MSSACSGWNRAAVLERMSPCLVSPQLRKAGWCQGHASKTHKLCLHGNRPLNSSWFLVAAPKLQTRRYISVARERLGQAAARGYVPMSSIMHVEFYLEALYLSHRIRVCCASSAFINLYNPESTCSCLIYSRSSWLVNCQ